jgi:hypothetical protein
MGNMVSLGRRQEEEETRIDNDSLRLLEDYK